MAATAAEAWGASMTDELPSQALSNLIGSIYDCALDPSRWEQALDDARILLECQTAMLGVLDRRDNRFLIKRTVGLDQEGLEILAKHAHEINSILSNHLANIASLDEPFVASRHLSSTYVDSSPYLQAAKSRGLIDFIDYHLMHSPARIADFGVGRDKNRGVFTEREIELGRLLLPHVRRAVIVSNVLDVCTIERTRMVQTLDALRCGVVLTDDRGFILHANRCAETMLQNRDPVQDVHGVLQAKAPFAARELSAALKLAAQDENKIGKTGLAIRLSGLDAPPVFAHVLPLTGGDLRTRLKPEAVAAVFIGMPQDEQDTADVVATSYDLTPAETRVLASLLAGRTLAETATSLGIALTTARTHLNRIFLKTGVSRQSELMRLAMRVSTPAHFTGSR